MPKKTKKSVKDYRHDKTRKNNPPAGLVDYEPKVKEHKTKHYAYNPHLSPQLIWADKPGLKTIEVEDKAGVEAETVSLHVHERVSSQAIINAVKREAPQIDLFAKPELPFHEAIKFYQHDVNWSNRLILGDSLLVANSLIEREMMAGKVQMIYMDPPYGVKYASNFQARIDKRDVKDKDNDLTREPEMIKAYRDTWKLGIHSYLTYMRDRLRVARELLTDSGSVFVQISDENVHLVRNIMDEVFGVENFVSIIPFRTAMTKPTGLLNNVCDFILWYSKDKNIMKFNPLFRKIDTSDEISTQQLEASTIQAIYEFEFQGHIYNPTKGWRLSAESLKRIAVSGRIKSSGTLRFIRYSTDFGYHQLDNLWTQQLSEQSKVYVVQTSNKVIEKCLLMTTDPGDIVFDPTCGSGTSAYVAEQWGRRWITCDTSRVALSIARQRLLTAVHPYYKIEDENGGTNPGYGFKYKTVPHITLKSIAQNMRIDPVAEEYNPRIEKALKKLNNHLVKTRHAVSLEEWEVPFEADENWNDETVAAWEHFRKLKRDKQTRIDAIIAEDAPQETLYDQPEKDNKTVRVTGPFTVEAIPAPGVEASPIEGMDDELESFADDAPIAMEDENHIPYLITLMQKDGVLFPDNKKMVFESLNTRSGGVIHAEGQSDGKQVGISFGPLHGPVSIMQVTDGLREANLGGFDEIIFCGFAFDPEAQSTISENPHPKVQAHMSHIKPDVLLTDDKGDSLLKTTTGSQLFTVFGEPDIELNKSDDEYTITLNGVDVYDPVDGVVHSENAGRVAAWFLDTDYDGRTFCITQAFFPDKSAWKKIERALKGTLDEDLFEMLTEQESLPFKKGKHEKVAVKVIDPRGNEVMKVVKLGTKF